MVVKYIGTFFLNPANANHTSTPISKPKIALETAPVAIQSHPPAQVVIDEGIDESEREEGMDVGREEGELSDNCDIKVGDIEVITEDTILVCVMTMVCPLERVVTVDVTGPNVVLLA